MPFTARHVYYPNEGDTPDVPRDLTTLANRVDAEFVQMTGAAFAAASPDANLVGRRIRISATGGGYTSGQVFLDIGTAFVADSADLSSAQPLDADLTALAGLPSAVDKVPYATGPNAWALATLTAFARNILDDADAPTARTTLGAALAPANVLAAQQILDVGRVGQIRAGRTLTAADFTTLLGLTAPVGLYPLSDVNDSSGNARNLTNKGAVPFGVGINGLATTAAVFAGSTAQALYVADTGAADPFRIKTGAWGAWIRTAKRGTAQTVLSKWGAAGVRAWSLYVETTNVPVALLSLDGTASLTITGVTDVADDRWHFVVVTFDGSIFRLYVDGALEASATAAGAIFGSAAPLNVGAQAADGATAATTPFFGRVDNAFVTADAPDEAQVRLLMAQKVAHGYAVAPKTAIVNTRRLKRGGALVTGDFSATPKHLYNLTNLNDAGSLANNLTNNAGAVQGTGPDGAANGAYIFNGSTQYLSVTDAGLPSGTAARTITAWIKSNAQSQQTIVAYGSGTNRIWFEVDVNGVLTFDEGVATTTVGPRVTDGQWHHVALVIESAPADGLIRKVYLDGKLIGSATTAVNSTTLGGANAFRIGASLAGGQFWAGSLARVAITDYAMSPEEVGALFAKGSGLVGPAGLVVPDLDEQDLRQIVQGMDATNVYLLGDVRRRISGKVNGDGTIAEAIGGDFRVVRNSAGVYALYFPPGFFSSPPTMTAVTGGGSVGWMRIDGPYTVQSIAGIQTFSSAAANVDPAAGWNFTAEGRGPLPSQNTLDLAVAA